MTQLNIPAGDAPVEVATAVVNVDRQGHPVSRPSRVLGRETVPIAVAVASAPTQLRRPWRATVRTFVQTLIPTLVGLVLVVPEVVEVILEESGEQLPERARAYLLAISAACATIAAILARLMAIPAVEQLLRRIPVLQLLAAAPAPNKTGSGS